MTRTFIVCALLALVALSYVGMRRGWNARMREQAGLLRPRHLFSADVVAGPWSGRFLGTAFADRWLDTVTAHTLGARSVVEVSLTTEGININRPGELSFGVPKADVRGVRADKALAGRAYEDGGIVVLTFMLGDTAVDAGFRFPDTEDHLAALAALAPEVTQ